MFVGHVLARSRCEGPGNDRDRSVWLRLVVLGLGFALGSATHVERWLWNRPGSGPRVEEPEPVSPLPPRTPRTDHGLSTLQLEIPPESMATLRALRAAALERGILAP